MLQGQYTISSKVANYSFIRSVIQNMTASFNQLLIHLYPCFCQGVLQYVLNKDPYLLSNYKHTVPDMKFCIILPHALISDLPASVIFLKFLVYLHNFTES